MKDRIIKLSSSAEFFYILTGISYLCAVIAVSWFIYFDGIDLRYEWDVFGVYLTIVPLTWVLALLSFFVALINFYRKNTGQGFRILVCSILMFSSPIIIVKLIQALI